MKSHLICLAILIGGFFVGVRFGNDLILGSIGSIVGVHYGIKIYDRVAEAAKYAALHPRPPKVRR